jgi:hypothetical protein
MTGSGPPPKKSRLQTKSIAKFFKPATTSLAAALSAEIENGSQKQPPIVLLLPLSDIKHAGLGSIMKLHIAKIVNRVRNVISHND